MEILLYISAIIAAVAFAVLVIYLVRTLILANRTLDHVPIQWQVWKNKLME